MRKQECMILIERGNEDERTGTKHSGRRHGSMGLDV